MNPNFDFREPMEWGDSTIDPSSPSELKKYRNRVIGWSTVILTALFGLMTAVLR